MNKCKMITGEGRMLLKVGSKNSLFRTHLK